MIAIVADIHGNLPALRAVIARADGKGCTEIICLGDVTGYYAQPGECIEALRCRGARAILGNHDWYLTSGTSCPRSKTVSGLIDYQRSMVTPDQLAWLKALPQTLRENGNWFVHGGWNDPIDEYLYTISALRLPGDRGAFFSAHTHVQTLARFSKKTYCNPGSVGQPRDGDPRAAFAIVGGDEILLERVEYDIDETAYAMDAAGFPRRLYECLYSGAQIGGRIDKVTIETDE
jgi:diadenosine tetraphosphatase ApaH/serine/threonine PP2A family protein phosphatase